MFVALARSIIKVVLARDSVAVPVFLDEVAISVILLRGSSPLQMERCLSASSFVATGPVLANVLENLSKPPARSDASKAAALASCSCKGADREI